MCVCVHMHTCVPVEGLPCSPSHLVKPGQYPHDLTPTGVDNNIATNGVQHINGVSFPTEYNAESSWTNPQGAPQAPGPTPRGHPMAPAHLSSQGRAVKEYGFEVRAPTGQRSMTLPLSSERNMRST